jgi:hypothetical protein
MLSRRGHAIEKTDTVGIMAAIKGREERDLFRWATHTTAVITTAELRWC